MDRKGMIGFPLRLAVTFMILSIAVPSMIYLTDDLADRSDLSSVRAETDRISDVMSKTYYSGIGSRNTVDVSVTEGCSIRLGGEDSESYTMTILKGDDEMEHIYLQRPAVRILGEAVEISGDRTLMCESAEYDGHYGVKVIVVD